MKWVINISPFRNTLFISPVNFIRKNQQIDRRKIKNMKRISPQPQSKMLKTLLDNNDLGIAVAVYADKDGGLVKTGEHSEEGLTTNG